jgi:hypothetical protein
MGCRPAWPTKRAFSNALGGFNARSRNVRFSPRKRPSRRIMSAPADNRASATPYLRNWTDPAPMREAVLAHSSPAIRRMLLAAKFFAASSVAPAMKKLIGRINFLCRRRDRSATVMRRIALTVSAAVHGRFASESCRDNRRPARRLRADSVEEVRELIWAERRRYGDVATDLAA